MLVNNFSHANIGKAGKVGKVEAGKVISISRDYSKAFWALLNLYLVRTIGVPKLKIWEIIVSDKKKISRKLWLLIDRKIYIFFSS